MHIIALAAVVFGAAFLMPKLFQFFASVFLGILVGGFAWCVAVLLCHSLFSIQAFLAFLGVSIVVAFCRS